MTMHSELERIRQEP